MWSVVLVVACFIIVCVAYGKVVYECKKGMKK